MRCVDPARMPPTNRLAELGEILAAGVQRLLAKNIKPAAATNMASNTQDQLDAAAAVEAQCGSPIEVPA